ncbi:MAG: 16S rRNA (cytosine(1402)-N(4))-methyltransferase RsmH [Pseudarcicella sp.]|nr:16S rRNA (cytosine(1402)-N(4))-methyltransferase RsmH [Pseudarcicella sp.]MBP6410322.1 16S rRNA (cytosine(1402)-N(4))-methyltransferase RsmH [Pseudarcicella sp.]
MEIKEDYHLPVLLAECIEGLNINPSGVYVDLTFGGGGHSKAILNALGEKGKLFSFDQDTDAKKNANLLNDDRFCFVETNFRNVKKYLRLHGIKQVDGILADLGISSFQIDEPTRGFSIRFDGELDMRMNQAASFSAKNLINEYSASELQRVFGQYGEVHNAKTLAEGIVQNRMNNPINTTAQLKDIIEKYAPKFREFKYFAQVFQAIRIEVNQELLVIEEMLEQIKDILKPDGRLCVISFHSLEDRLVKNYIKKGKFHGEVEKDLFGNEIKPLKSITKKPIEATEEETKQNPRARSAKLRIATLN